MIPVLFTRVDSIYRDVDGCDPWDAERDARLWPGGSPVVAHPPCRAWGRLRRFANPRPDEMDLARWAVQQVRRWGGVLEHPRGSTLWEDQQMPHPGEVDDFGGWTLPILQQWWGHKAEKATWLYIVGCRPMNTPPIPLVLGDASHTVSSSGKRADGSRYKGRPELLKWEREATPRDLAIWLVELARRCGGHNATD